MSISALAPILGMINPALGVAAGVLGNAQDQKRQRKVNARRLALGQTPLAVDDGSQGVKAGLAGKSLLESIKGANTDKAAKPGMSDKPVAEMTSVSVEAPKSKDYTKYGSTPTTSDGLYDEDKDDMLDQYGSMA